MKKTFTLCLARPAFLRALSAPAICILLTIFTTALTAQTYAVALDMVPTTDQPVAGAGSHQNGQWKALPEYSAVLSAERTNTALLLATPNLKDSKTALYESYDRMLGYMQADIIANVPVDGIAGENFKKVILETASDPILNKIIPSEFDALYIALVQMLTQ